ncbi:MAG: hypothetical protein WAW41_07425 [Methylobacter sp.]
MSKLSDIVHIERRFARSARIDEDLKGTPPLVGYVMQGSITKALAAMGLAQLETRQGAFTWTGPYGGGKSSAALLLGNLVGGAHEGRTIARKTAGTELAKLFAQAFPETSGDWSVVPVTGSRAELRKAIATAAAKTLGWDHKAQDKANSSDDNLIAALFDASNKERSGILLIIDELGKFLEYAVANHGDIHLLQDLAERSSRSDGRFVILGILHQTFDQYAGRLTRETRQEWAKVQGRFQDISFLAGVDETVALLGRAIIVDRPPTKANVNAANVANAVAARRPADSHSLKNALSATWPLNPVTALMLGPVSRQRFAQNERSVFGFLASAEPHGFVEFLQNNSVGDSIDYGPDQLWDYLAANFGMALASGKDSHRFSLAFEAIDRAAAKGSSVHVSVTKCAAVIEFFRNGSGVAVANEFLEAALPGILPQDIHATINDLVEWAILIRQPRLGGYAMFAGSDFDLDEAIQKSCSVTKELEFATLPQRMGLGFVVAKRHYFRTGVLRAFEIVLHLIRSDEPLEEVVEVLRRMQFRGAGLMVLLLFDDSFQPTDVDEYAKALSKALYSAGVMAAVGTAYSAFRLQNGAAELFAIEAVAREHPQLQGDRIARREIAARRSICLDVLQSDLKSSLEDAKWWIGPNTNMSIKDGLSIVATVLADAAYSMTPILKSELVQRDRPSSNAMAAVRELAYAMIRSSEQEGLGFSGFPAERGLYLTVLSPFGLHGEISKGCYGFKGPDESEAGRSLSAAWMMLEHEQDFSLDMVFAAWALPPFGIKAGVMPILALASILARRERLAVYIDNVFQPVLDTYFVDRLLQNPSAIRLKKINRTVKEAGFLSALGSHLAIPGEPSALPIAQALFQRFKALPDFSKRTDHLSATAKAIRNVVLKADDPEALLFEALPSVVVDGDRAAVVMEALEECENAYSALLQKLRQALARVLGVSSSTFAGVAERATTVRGLTNDLRFDAFAVRAATFETGEGEVEGVASLLAHKPPRSWSDRDVDNALLEIARFGRRFREVEALAVVRNRKSNTEALALVVGVDPKTPPLLTSFELTETEKTEAVILAEKILHTLGGKGVDGSIRLAALARAVASLASEISPEQL